MILLKVISDSKVAIYSYEELKEVLQGDNNYSIIYLASNITLLGGINISKTKLNVTIDGTYDNIVHTLEDKKSASASDTISASSNTLKVTVQNMNIIGYNYYGIIYVPENSAYKNVEVEYSNITYVGPQISFHPTGLTRFMNSNITIETGYLAGNEVCECNKIEIGGITTIIHKSTSNSSFWFRSSNPYLKILKDSVVDFSSINRELFYGVNDLNLTIDANSKFYVTTHNGMAYSTFGTLNTVIGENSTFIIKQTGTNGSNATWNSYGTITVNNNATLQIVNNYSGIASSNYNIYFRSANSGFILNNPKKIFLYNSMANVIYTSSNIPFNFKYTRINLFNKALDIDTKLSLSSLPDFSWYKDDDLSIVSGKFSSSKCEIESNNYTTLELDKLPSLDNFVFANKKIFTIGDVNIRMNALTDKDTKIEGITKENSEVLIEYNDIVEVVSADDSGYFSYSYNDALPIGTIITLTVKEKDEFIYHTKVVQIVYSGELTLDDATKLILFKYVPLSLDPIICPRATSLDLTVTDSRVESTNWKLYASINENPKSDSNIELKNSLVYVDESGNITPLSSNKTLVYTGSKNDGSIKVTNVSFKENEGILLKVNDVLINNLEYKTDIIWSIEE